MAAESGLRRDLARWYKPPQFWSGKVGVPLVTAITRVPPCITE